MRWQGERQSDNVEDRRGVSPGQVAVGGGTWHDPDRADPELRHGGRSSGLIQKMGGRAAGRPAKAGRSAGPVQFSPEEQRQAALVKTTLAMTEDVWNEVFAKAGRKYAGTTFGSLSEPGANRGLRPGRHGGRAVLLSGRSSGLHRPGFL